MRNLFNGNAKFVSITSSDGFRVDKRVNFSKGDLLWELKADDDALLRIHIKLLFAP